MELEKRYRESIKKLGGAFGLLALPESVQKVLKETTDLKTKVEELEYIARELTGGK